MLPVLYIVVPCYNEEDVLPLTAELFLNKLRGLERDWKISPQSRILFVDDGSQDGTWQIICDLAKKDMHFKGIRQSRNRGHQNAVLAGLMEAKNSCDKAKIICKFIYTDNNSEYKTVTKQSMRSGSNVPTNTTVTVTIGK